LNLLSGIIHNGPTDVVIVSVADILVFGTDIIEKPFCVDAFAELKPGLSANTGADTAIIAEKAETVPCAQAESAGRPFVILT
jgi:hypothetical protein